MIDNNTIMFIILGIIFILVIIALILGLVNSSKISAYFDYTDDGDLMSAVKDYYDRVDELAMTINNSEDAIINNRITSCENDLKMSLRKIGVVNFNAFDDVTGQMSFALTILDNYNDGVILTSLYGHNSCNTYVRQIRNGKAEIKLLDEERESLNKAMIYEKKFYDEEEEDEDEE